MIALLDNKDSFTYNLHHYLTCLNQDVHVISEDEVSQNWEKFLNAESIVISPGPGVPGDHKSIFEILSHFQGEKPILGVCLGMQAFYEFYGGTIEKLSEPRHGKISQTQHQGSILFNGIPEIFDVTRYHSLQIKKYDQKIWSLSSESIDDNCIMSIEHNTLPLKGLQFHPEAYLTKYGMKILQNWIKSYR